MKMTKRISRREFLKGVSVSGVGLALAACAPITVLQTAPEEAGETGQEAAAVEQIQLEYWHAWTEQWEEMTQFVVDTFNDKNPDISASQTVVPGQELQTKLLSSVAAGSPPDVITIYSAISIPSLVEQKALLPFDDFAVGDELKEAQDWFHPAVFDLGEYKGQTWGFSYWQQTSCLGWNKAAFEEVGLDPEKPPTTFEELDAMAEQLTQAEGSQNRTHGAYAVQLLAVDGPLARRLI